MTGSGSLSDDFVLLDHDVDVHDVLSLSETDTSDAGETYSREAAAIIEALEEGPRGTLQDLSFGSFPQFLGGWYGSNPSAVGQTYTLDLDSPATNTQTANRGTPDLMQTPSSTENNCRPDLYWLEAQAVQPAAPTVCDTARSAAPVAAAGNTASAADEQVHDFNDVTVACSSTSARTKPAHPWIRTALAFDPPMICSLLAGASLAALLLLAMTSYSTRAQYPSDHTFAYVPTPAFHTTAVASGETRHVFNGLAMTSFEQPAAAAVGASCAPGVAGAVSQHTDTEKLQLLWWMTLNATAGRVGALHATVPAVHVPTCLLALPPCLRSVIKHSMRANMSSSQRVRLHLWLLTSAVRASPPETGHDSPKALQCAAPETEHSWTSGTSFLHPLSPLGALDAVESVNLVGMPAPLWAALTAPPSNVTQHLQQHVVCRCKPWMTSWMLASSSSSTCKKATWAPWTAGYSTDPRVGQHCLMTALRNGSWVSRETRDMAAFTGLLATQLATQHCALHTAAQNSNTTAAVPMARKKANLDTTATATAVSAPETSLAKAMPRAVVAPTKPVPLLYIPPLPCLHYSTKPINATAVSRPQKSTGRRAAAAPVSRTVTWPNTTARSDWHARPPRLLSRRYSLGGAAKTYARASAANSTQRGPQGRSQQQGAPSPLTLPMLPPVQHPLAATNTSSTTNSTSTSHASPRHPTESGSVVGPTFGPAAVKAHSFRRKQRRPQGHGYRRFVGTHGSKSSSKGIRRLKHGQHEKKAALRRSASAVTLPMLPPVAGSWAHASDVGGPRRSHSIHTKKGPQQQRHRTASTSSSSAKDRHVVGTCKAGDGASQGWIVMHQLQPPTAAAAARKQHYDGSASTAESAVFAIMREVNPYHGLEHEEEGHSAGVMGQMGVLRLAVSEDRSLPLYGLPGHGMSRGGRVVPVGGLLSQEQVAGVQHNWPPTQAAPAAAATRCDEDLPSSNASSLLRSAMRHLTLAGAQKHTGNCSGAVAVGRLTAMKHALGALLPGLTRTALPQGLAHTLSNHNLTSACAVPRLQAAAPMRPVVTSTPATSVGGNTRSAVLQNETGWVANLVTLPMLPPSAGDSLRW